MEGCGLSNTALYEHLPKEDKGDAIIFTEGGILITQW